MPRPEGRIDIQPTPLLSSAEASARLGVKRRTLYAYVSRGWVRCVRMGRAKERRYDAADVDRLATRAAARRGHGSVAAGALRWGEPVLDSAITEIRPDGPRYRGREVRELVRAGATFEEVADLLWQAEPGERWGHERPGPVPRAPTPVLRLVAAVAAAAAGPGRWRASSPAEERALARRLIAQLAHAWTGARRRGRVAERLGRALGVGPSATRALDAALVLSADHELNVSTFAARVAASAGADLVSCVGAALYAFTGPRHGTASGAVERLLDDLPRRLPAMARALRARIASGEGVPGFGHRLYPSGDPRAPPLLALAREHAARPAEVRRMEAFAGEVAASSGLRPALDFGLVALCRALALPAGSAAALFALGRTAGWVAHVLEQRASPALLRPRARYVGPER